jgi:hypothetical protein
VKVRKDGAVNHGRSVTSKAAKDGGKVSNWSIGGTLHKELSGNRRCSFLFKSRAMRFWVGSITLRGPRPPEDSFLLGSGKQGSLASQPTFGCWSFNVTGYIPSQEVAEETSI